MRPTYLTGTLIAFTLVAGLTLSSGAQAQAPQQLTVQGYLTDAEGALVDETVSVTFTLYTADGSVLYSEEQALTIDDGLLTAHLGREGIDLSLFRELADVELGVAIDGDAELEPRFRMATAPYAAFSQYAAEASAIAGGVAWSDLSDVPPGLDDGDADTLAGLSCATNYVARWNGAAWTCSPESPDQDTTYHGRAGINVFRLDSPCIGGDPGCPGWNIGLDTTYTDGRNDNRYVNVEEPNYGAGEGMTVAAANPECWEPGAPEICPRWSVSLDTAYADARYVTEDEPNSVTGAMIADGTITLGDIAPSARDDNADNDLMTRGQARARFWEGADIYLRASEVTSVASGDHRGRTVTCDDENDIALTTSCHSSPDDDMSVTTHTIRYLTDGTAQLTCGFENYGSESRIVQAWIHCISVPN